MSSSVNARGELTSTAYRSQVKTQSEFAGFRDRDDAADGRLRLAVGMLPRMLSSGQLTTGLERPQRFSIPSVRRS
jgi:hypothetical protein